VNFVLDDDVKADLDRLVASGKRSRVVNSALRAEIQRIRRRSASDRLDGLRARTVSMPSRQIVALLRADRGRR
jgi:predicted transcriptional regulator